MGRRFKAGLLAAVAAPALAASAIVLDPGAAGGSLSPDVKVKFAKRPEGPYNHQVFRGLGEGKRHDFYLKTKNRIGIVLAPSLGEDFLTASGYKTKYFRNGEITAAVQGAGFDYHLKPGKKKVFRVRIKRQAGAPFGGCLVDEVRVGGVREDFALVELNNPTECD